MTPRETEVRLSQHAARVLEWGDPDAPLVVALHGFPDTAWTWRRVAPLLAAQGFRVAAPFLRGYGVLPRDGVVTVPALAADTVALHEALGGDERAVLVGHDWGAVVANALAAHERSPYRSVVSLAVPPFPAMNPSREVLGPWSRAVLRQPLRSWYILANQVPGLSERAFWPLVTRLWRDWSPGYDAREDLARLREAVPDRAHARAVVSYYRAVLRPGAGAAAYRDWDVGWNAAPRAPLLYLHGAQDGCLDPRFVPVVAARLPDPHRVVAVEGAGHFLQLEQPDAVAAHVLDRVGPA